MECAYHHPVGRYKSGGEVVIRMFQFLERRNLSKLNYRNHEDRHSDYRQSEEYPKPNYNPFSRAFFHNEHKNTH